MTNWQKNVLTLGLRMVVRFLIQIFGKEKKSK